MLELKDVSAYLEDAAGRNRVFGPLSLQVQTGEICTIIGPSGCGKTSLLRTLAGLEESFDGSIQMDGKYLKPITSKIAYVPQTFGLLEFKTVRENILLPLKIRDISINKELIWRFYYLTGRLNIEDILDEYPAQLSISQRQSIAIARSLVMKPDLLLMDEPFCSLDSLSRECAQKKLKEILMEFGTTTLMVTHSIEEAIYLGNRVIVLSSGAGKIIADITALDSRDEDRVSTRFVKLTSIIRQLIKEDWRENRYEKNNNIC